MSTRPRETVGMYKNEPGYFRGWENEVRGTET